MLEQILQYIETTGAQDSDLSGHISVARPQEPLPQIKDYGLRVYFEEGDWLVTRREKIGPILTNTYRVNVDLVFNKSYNYRQVFSATKGISYWQNTIMVMFANKTANGLFRDSLWTTNGVMEQNAESVVLRGILTIVTDEVLLNN